MHRALLSDAVYTIGGLGLLGRIPMALQMDRMVRLRDRETASGDVARKAEYNSPLVRRINLEI